MMTRRKTLAAAAFLPAALMGAAGGDRKPLRYLQIGTGHAHANKISVYQKSGDWEVVGIVEEDPALLEKAKQNPVFNQHRFLTLEEGLNTPELKVIGSRRR